MHLQNHGELNQQMEENNHLLQRSWTEMVQEDNGP